ncbi:MAG: alanine--tRNA ligase [Actinobacteria bacterium]|nr:MAG: alanine--tRNA ligase [Actinomycetota bacterium]
MKSDDIRARFLDYFQRRDHRLVMSSSLIPDDPTLLVTNAGMVQFKPYFLGSEKPEFTRATTCQKCVRTTDIEKVGHTARHLTFFEMLGNFSFGDYYKREAIPWGWEFLTVDMGLDRERLYCSVFTEDDEAYDIWKDVVGVPEERLVRLGAEDNFWDMGTTGPCGPCSEILYDQGEEYGCGDPGCRVGCDCDRYLELWNLVFMQYHRDEKGELHPLPSKNIDTGLGLERLASVLQGAPNNFETDTMAEVLHAASHLSGVDYGSGEESDISLKIVADHSRAVTFMVADGVLPSNEDRGYILRRLVRRAVRHGRLLGITDVFLPRMVETVIEIMGDAYPELKQNSAFIDAIIHSEEERFSQTLRSGLVYLEEAVSDLKSRGGKVIPGDVVFHLHDTLGFPLELTRELARERGLELEEEGFAVLMEGQRERARAARIEEGYAPQVLEIYSEILDNYGESRFTGYETVSDKAAVLAIVNGGHAVASAAPGEEVEVFLDRTPFYGEMGGQVGDTGTISSPAGVAEVIETFHPARGLISHRCRIAHGEIKISETVEASVDAERRNAIRRNHTATHIVHWALRQVLGDHAKQAGSLVDPGRLRFDFTHFQPLSRDELARVEELSNRKVIEDLPVRAYVTTYDYAISINAVALFGEKYEDYVRVVEVDEISRELCGGTHVGRTGEIGLLVIAGESGIGANMRRIEAFTGMGAYAYFHRRQEMLNDMAEKLKAEVNRLPDRIDRVLQRVKELESAMKKRGREEAASLVDGGIDWKESEAAGGVKILTAAVDGLAAQDLRELAERTLTGRAAGVVGIATIHGGKANMVVALSKELTGAGLDAVELMRKAGRLLGGGGGGRPDMAVGGGSDTSRMDEALAVMAEEVKRALEGHA